MNQQKIFLLNFLISLSLINLFQVKLVKPEPIFSFMNKNYSRVFIIGMGIYLIYNQLNSNSKSKPSAGTYVYKK